MTESWRMTSSPIPLRMGQLMSLTLLSFLLNSRVMYPRPMKASQDTTVGTHLGDGENALSSPLLPLKSQRATFVKSTVGVVGARA